MKTNTILRMLRREKREFITSKELKKICRRLGVKYESAIRHLIPRGHLVRVFRGIFYVKSLEEDHLGSTKYSHLELVAKGLEIKGVKSWYFGLTTALVLNNMTHEHFAVDYVLNDVIQRSSPMDIAGYGFVFKKVKSNLLSFGILENGIRYSDPEKTILDTVYLDRYGGVSPQKTALNVSEYFEHIDKDKLKKYVEEYPLTVSTFLEEYILEG
jgi:predicted transcriptional regulator of viral defense system